MAKNKFICPDRKTVYCDDCLQSCRMGSRCLALPLLVHGSKTRDLNREHFSVTEVLSPTLIIYLRWKYGELINPYKVMPSSIGTSMHGILEDCLPHGYAGEFRLEYQGLTGQMDCIDLKGKTLYDYKVTSTYKACRMLGYQSTFGYKEITRGKNKGEKKWSKIWIEGTHDYGDYAKQQNLYRILLAKNGIEVNDMYLQAIIKEPESTLLDTPLKATCHLIKVPKMNDKRLLEYALYKKDLILKAIQNDELPKPCTHKERWGGRRCKDYCTVSWICPYKDID